MPPGPITENTLFYGDNLPILQDYVPDASVDLIYLDPPFNSNRTYNVLFKDEGGHDSEAQIAAFEDTWHWNRAAESTYDELAVNGPQHVGRMIAAMRDFIGANQMMAYLVMMTARLVELHRVLKPTGSLYLHCDPTASHYLKVILDTIFGAEVFLNEIIWQRTAAKGDVRRKFGAVHDSILVYVKGKGYQFESQHTEPDEEYEQRFKYNDNDGRGPYQSAPLDSPNPRPNLTYDYKGYKPPTKGWRVSREVMEKLDLDGKLIFPSNLNGRIRRKVYLHEQKGPKATDVWTDIPPLQFASAERLGYPTQKPLALLERIVSASSNPGDWVLDPFCGCGTAVAAAQKLGRRWIGIDVTFLSISLQRSRLQEMFPGISFRVVGEPESLNAARYLAQHDRFQFEWWALSLVGARPSQPTTRRAGRAHGKKGADRGVDGVINFMDDTSGKPKRVLVQVKSGKVSARDVRDLRGAMEREQAAIGLFLTLEAPTAPMEQEAVEAGFYHSPGWNQKFPRVQILTIEALLDGARATMPPAWGTFKQAERVQEPPAVQGTLDLGA